LVWGGLRVSGLELQVSGLDFLNKWVTNGMKLKGGKDDWGFLFFYELMTVKLQT